MIFDVAIVGAGPAGLALAIGLKGAGLSIALVERRGERSIAEPADDGREIALTHHSVSLLQRLGAWNRIPPEIIAPLREARVQNGPSPYALRLDPAFASHPDGRPLGQFVPNAEIRRALHATAWHEDAPTLLAGASVETVSPKAAETKVLGLADGRRVEARLVIAADSRLSSTRGKAGITARVSRYGQRMVVCRMRHTRPHRGVSTAWFDYGRQLSILPLRGDRCSVVLALPEREAGALLEADEAAFSARVTALFRSCLGVMSADGERHSTDVVTAYADRFVGPRFALVGDAAVGMHPVTAQGFNLGLLGAGTLAGLVRGAARSGRDIGGDVVLGRYERAHRSATWLAYQATTAIVRLYGTDALPARMMRDAGLRLANTVPLLRRTVLTKMMEG